MVNSKEASISSICNEVIKHYQDCMGMQDAFQLYKLIKTEYDRLKIWASSIGVYTHTGASADDRLRDNDDLRAIVVELLVALSDRLQRYISPYNNSDNAEVSESSEDASSSSEDGIQTQEIQAKDARLLRYIRRVNSRLFSVLALVRQPTHLTSNEKVFRFDFEKQLSKDSYKGLIEDFETHIRFYLNHKFESDNSPMVSSLSGPIFAKLLNGAIIRRKALILKKRHKRKLRANAATKFNTEPHRFKNVTIIERAIEQQRTPKISITATPSKFGSADLSETVPSVVLNPATIKAEHFRSQPAPKSSKSRILMRGRLDIPRPPRLEVCAREFECYICGLMLDRTSISNDRWTKHVLEDIDAFVCLFECDKPDVLYKTSEDWYEHMQTHRMQWSCMTPAHAHLIFDSKNDLEIHLSTNHPSKLSQSQIEMLAKRGQRPLPMIFEECPLCGQTASDLEANTTSTSNLSFLSPTEKSQQLVRSLHRHIESHMYELALLSILPKSEATAMSESVAANEDLTGIINDATGLRLDEEDLVLLPRDIGSLQEPRTFNSDLTTAISENQVCPAFFDFEPQQAGEQWTAFLDSQRPPPDLHEWLELWQTSCQRMRDLSDVTHRHDDRWHDDNKMLLADLQALTDKKAGCVGNPMLFLSIAEGLCTNIQIVRTIRKVTDPLDIVIEPPSESGERRVTIFFLSTEDAETALSDLDAFQICDTRIAAQPAFMTNTSAPSISTDPTAQLLSQKIYGRDQAGLAMESVPPTPIDYYEQMLSNIHADHHDIMRRILMLLCFAEGGLTLNEINDSLAINKQTQRYESDRKLSVPGSILSICPRLIEVDQLNPSLGTGSAEDRIARSEDQIVRFTHPSLREYFVSDRIKSGPAKMFALSESEVEASISMLCLIYLNQKQLDGQNMSDHYTRTHPFIRYAARNWISHFKRVQNEAAGDVFAQAYKLCTTENLFKRWFKLHDALDDMDEAFGKHHEFASSVYYLALHGLDEVLSKILHDTTSRLNVNAQGGTYGNALQAASVRGHVKIVKILTSAGANPNARGGVYDSALQAASFAGHSELVQWLLGCGADINMKGGRYGNAAHAALVNGQDLVFQLLIDHGIDLEVIGFRVNSEFQTAAENGHTAVIPSLLKLGADINDVDTDARTRLAWGARNGVESLVRILLEHGALVNTIDDWGYTPLCEASKHGYDIIAELLLSHGAGAHIEVSDTYSQCTPLMWAAQYGHEAVVQILLTHGAQVDSFDKDQKTALSYASSHGHEAVVRILLKHNADPNLCDHQAAPLILASEAGHEDIALQILAHGAQADLLAINGRSPLSYASERGQNLLVRALLEQGAQVDLTDQYQRTPVLYASMNGQTPTVRLLLERGAQADSTDEYQRTPISYASENGDDPTVQLLLECGAQADTMDSLGRTPISYASGRGHEVTVRLLLENGTLADSMDSSERTPLSYASEKGHESTVRLLLEQGTDIDSLDQFQRTPISYASEFGHEIIVRLLLVHGPSVHTVDSGGLTPLSHAAKAGHEAMAQLLLEHGAQVDPLDNYYQCTPLSWASWLGHEAVARLLIIHGAQIDSSDIYERTPLSYASGSGSEGIAKLLLERGAQVESLDKTYQSTPLSWAAWGSHEAVVQLLLANGASIDSADINGRTPLSWTSEAGFEAITRFLIERGAQIDLADQKGWTPLTYAANTGYALVVQLLLDVGATIHEMNTNPDQIPLVLASRNGHEATVTVLLDARPNLYIHNQQVDIALHVASEHGHDNIVSILTTFRSKSNEERRLIDLASLAVSE